MKNTLAFISALHFAFLGIVGFSSLKAVAVDAETDNHVTIQANQNVTEGNIYYGYVYIDNLENIASLNVSIHYYSSVLNVTSSYNLVSCSIYDSSNKNETLNYSYIFNNNEANVKTSLFYFAYSIKDNLSASSSFFDITIDEAYDNSLNNADVEGSRFYFNINKQQSQNKYCYVYAVSYLNTKIQEEFEISYRFDTTQIASGTIEIQYDRDLFEFISLNQQGFLTGKMVDINSNLEGAVSLSFLGTEYASRANILTIRFSTISNDTTNSSITFSASGLYDLDLNSINCVDSSTTVSITYDGAFDENVSKVYLTSQYNASNSQISVLVSLSANSQLGAGDFVLRWNKDYLDYNSYTKRFNPSFFNVNDKVVSDGQIKFSIISLTDIITTEDIIEIKFNAKSVHDDTNVLFTIMGSGLSDSLTNPINLNFVNCNETIPGHHFYGEWSVTKEATCTEAGEEHRVCSVCGHEETRTIKAHGHFWEEEWTIDVEATCKNDGSKSHHCSVCGEKNDVTVIPVTNHIAAAAVKENEVAATCTTCGLYDLVTYCEDCGEELSREHVETEATGHTYGEWSVTKEATCTEAGEEHRVCSVCGHEETREISKLDASPFFIETVNSINLENDTLEESFNKIKQAIEYYNMIDDKSLVADTYQKLQNIISSYNALVNEANTNHSDVTNSTLSLALSITASVNLLSLGLFLLKKQVFK